MASPFDMIGSALDRVSEFLGITSPSSVSPTDVEGLDVGVGARNVGAGLASDALMYDAGARLIPEYLSSFLEGGEYLPRADTISHELIRACERSSASDVYGINFLRLARDHAVGKQGIVVELRDSRTQERLPILESRWMSDRDALSMSGLAWWDLERLLVSSLVNGGAILCEFLKADSGLGLQLHSTLELPDGVSDGVAEHSYGVKRNAWGRPTSYRLLTGSEFSDGGFTGSGREVGSYRDVPSSRMLHVFERKAVHQYRGLPLLGPALFWLKVLADYEEAFMVGCQIASYNPGFFTFPEGLAGHIYNNPQFENESYGSGSGSDDDTNTERTRAVLESIRRRVSTMNPRQRSLVPEGVEWHPIAGGNYNGGWYGEIHNQLVGAVAASLGVSYHTLAGDVSRANMASLTLAYSEDKVFYDNFQVLLGAFVKGVLYRWLGLNYGRDASSVSIDLRYNQQEPLNAVRTAQANAIMKDHGVMSRADWIRERGDDPDRVSKELEDE